MSMLPSLHVIGVVCAAAHYFCCPLQSKTSLVSCGTLGFICATAIGWGSSVIADGLAGAMTQGGNVVTDSARTQWPVFECLVLLVP